MRELTVILDSLKLEELNALVLHGVVLGDNSNKTWDNDFITTTIGSRFSRLHKLNVLDFTATKLSGEGVVKICEYLNRYPRILQDLILDQTDVGRTAADYFSDFMSLSSLSLIKRISLKGCKRIRYHYAKLGQAAENCPRLIWYLDRDLAHKLDDPKIKAR